MGVMSSTDQPDTHWRRLLPAGGIAYAALLVAGAVAFPMPPDGRAPGRDPAFLDAHRTAVALQGYVRAVAALAFFLLVLAVARRIASPLAARLAVVGGAGFVAFLLGAQGAEIGAVIASRDQAGLQAVQALGSLSDGLLTVSSLPAIGLFATAGIALREDPSVPRWLSWLTLLGVPLALLDAGSFSGSPLEPVGVLGLAFFLVWSLATGATLLTLGRYPVPGSIRSVS